MKKINIVVLTCVHQRPEILRFFLFNFGIVREAVSDIMDMTLIMAGSQKDEECHQIFDACEMPYVGWLESENRPLGRKWNSTLDPLCDMTYDFVLIMGSDDVISEGLLRKYYQAIQDGYNYLGVTDFYMLDSKSGNSIFWGGYTNNRKGETLGAARLIPRQAIEDCDYQLWDDGMNKTLDSCITRRIKKLSYIREKKFSCRQEGVALLDIKSDTNIWSFSFYKSSSVKIDTKKMLNENFAPEFVNLLQQSIPIK